MAAPAKDTIYIDIDDEITAIIDKLAGSKGKVVALVLPKRAAVLQSIVNMRLLKRAADESKKNVVLITSEAGLLPLAGVVGLHVAKTLSSKPEIPVAPTADDDEETIDEDADEVDDHRGEITAATAGAVAVGALAGMPPKPSDDMETVELDDDDLPGDDSSTPATTGSKDFVPPPVKKKKDSKLKVPNFERFRLLLVLGVLALIIVIGGLVYATTVLPKAVVVVHTDASNVNVGLNLTLSTTATSLDTKKNVVPAKLVTQQKTYTQQTATTGQKNQGTKATGSVVFYNCDKSDRLTSTTQVIPAGTGISSGGKTYITQTKANVPPSDFKGDGTCRQNAPSNSVTVVAQSAGTGFNTNSNINFTVSYNNPDGTNSFSANSNDGITGGTDNNVQVVSQTDIDTAKGKIVTSDSTMKKTLEDQLVQGGYYAITATYSAGTPVVTTNANVGDATSSVTVTEVVTYTMFGVHESDLKTLVNNNVETQIDTSKQSILTDGLDTASFSVQSSTSTGAELTMQTTATVGPDLNADDIKKQIAGMKSGQIKTTLGNNPDVTSVDVKFSPFWVNSVPKNASKVTVTIAKPATTVNSSNGSNP